MKNRQEFAQEVIEYIRVLPISSIIEKRVRLVRRGGYLKGLCPFHNDMHIGSFIVSDRKNIFKCFSCGMGGDGIKFRAELDGINYVESAMQIALEIGRISVSEYEDFFSRRFDSKKAKKIEKVYIEKDRDKVTAVIAEPEVLNKVFLIFCKGESLMEGKEKLSAEHKEYLLKERELSEEDIEEDGYFTFPSRRIFKNFVKALNDAGMNEEILKDIPGFYKDKSTGKYSFIKYNGIAIPIKNANGQIVGIQIRRDKVKENMSRYIWFSSTFLEDDEGNRYENCTGSGSPIDVVYPKRLSCATIFITEGRFKAKKIANTFGCIAISVQGVGNWRNIIEEIKIIKRRYKQVSLNNVFVAFDADMAFNIAVYQQASKMTDKIKEEMKLNLFYCMWAVEYGKGIDDMIINGYQDRLDKMDKGKFDCLYKKFISKIEETQIKTKKYETINKVPVEILKAYFDRDVLPKFAKYAECA